MISTRITTGMCVVAILAAARAAAAAGTFSSAAIGGDADSGISPARTYTHAVDFVSAPTGWPTDTATTINGVPFHAGGVNGPNYASTGLTMPWFVPLPTNSVPSGPDTLYDLFEDFLHNSTVPSPDNQTLTLTGLTPGTQYVTSFYGVGFDPDADRVITVTTSDGGQTVFDQNFTGEGNPNVLRYGFTADGTSITYTFDPVGIDTFHHYGFTNEIVPEPSAAGAAAALVGLAALRRRRKGIAAPR